jgi:hypothetical protein
MTRINAACLSAGLLTAIVLFALRDYPAMPLWAMFITWACFFHLGGDQDPSTSFRITLTHILVGVVSAWVSALILFASPWTDGLLSQLWAPLVIGLVIGLLVRLSAIGWLAVTPAIIYGYASVWAFLSTSGHFSLTALQSLSMQNVVIVLPLCVLMGVCMGYINVRMVRLIAPNA